MTLRALTARLVYFHKCTYSLHGTHMTIAVHIVMFTDIATHF